MRNLSVITTVRLALFRNCQLPSYPVSRIKLSSILHTGYHFEVIPGIKPLSCSFEETEKDSEAGTCFEKKLKFELSKLRPELSALLDRYAHNQVVAVITDANGYSWLVYPLIRTIKRSLPGTAKKANLTEVNFSGKGICESPCIELDS